MRKISKRLTDIQRDAISATLPPPAVAAAAAAARADDDWRPVEASMAAELDAAGNEVTAALREKQRAMLSALDISR
jgi:N-acetyltransferase 10